MIPAAAAHHFVNPRLLDRRFGLAIGTTAESRTAPGRELIDPGGSLVRIAHRLLLCARALCLDRVPDSFSGSYQPRYRPPRRPCNVIKIKSLSACFVVISVIAPRGAVSPRLTLGRRQKLLGGVGPPPQLAPQTATALIVSRGGRTGRQRNGRESGNHIDISGLSADRAALVCRTEFLLMASRRRLVFSARSEATALR